MLSEDVMEKLSERLTNRINETNEYILKRIGECVKKIGALPFSKAQQLAQILKYGGDYNKIVKKLAELTGLNVNEIKKIFTEAAKANQAFVKPFYEYRNVGFTPYDENEALKRQVEAIAKITQNQYLNIAKTSGLGYLIKDKDRNIVFRSLDYVYKEVIDRAVLSVAQGKTTFDTEMYGILKDIGKSGLRYIEYETGNIRRLDSAVRMNLLDGLRSMVIETGQEFGKEFGADGVEISVHEYPAPDHAQVQGKQFKNQEFQKFQNDEVAKSYDGVKFSPEFNGHDRRSIGQYNCYHYTFPVVLGVSEPLYSKDELRKILERNAKGFNIDGKHYKTKYEGTQMQRQLETRIREQKDLQILAKESGNTRLLYESQKKINELKDKYIEFSKAAELPTKMERLRVSKYRPIKVKENIPAAVSTNKQPKEINYEYLGKIGAQEMQAKSDKIFANLTEEEKNSLNKYTWGLEYKTINWALNEQKGDVTKTSFLENTIRNIDNCMKPIGKNIITFKGTNYEYYSKYKIDDTFTIYGFNSTSINNDIAMGFFDGIKNYNNSSRYGVTHTPCLLEIRVPKEIKGLYLGENSRHSGEQELLLDRGLTYKLIGKENFKYEGEEFYKLIMEVVEVKK